MSRCYDNALGKLRGGEEVGGGEINSDCWVWVCKFAQLRTVKE